MYELDKTLLTSDGTKIRYRVKKGSSKKWIVFLHGFRVNSSVWTEYISYFEKKGYSTLIMDLRGHGLSGKPRKMSRYKLLRYSKDLEELIKKENISQFILVGYSMGGTISLNYSSEHPKNVLKLILISTASELKSDMRRRTRILFPLAMTMFDSLRALYSKFYEKESVLLDFSKLKHKDSLEMLFEIAKDNVTRLNVIEFASIIAFNAKKAAKNVNIPTLIIGGSKDELFSLHSFKNLQSQIKNSILKMFDGTHCLVFVKPKPLIKEIEKFILQ